MCSRQNSGAHVQSLVHKLLYSDAVSGSDLQRVGEKLMHSNPSMTVIGELENIPARREVETALFEKGGNLTKKRSTLFSFNAQY